MRGKIPVFQRDKGGHGRREMRLMFSMRELAILHIIDQRDPSHA